MLAMILAAILGASVVYFSMQNQELVSIQIGNYLWSNIPLYLVMLGSLLVGLVMAGIVQLASGISSSMALWNKENEARKLRQLVVDLRNRLKEYQSENSRLRGNQSETQAALTRERVDHTKTQARGFFDRLRYRLSL